MSQDVKRILRTTAICLLALANGIVGLCMIGLGGCFMNRLYGALVVLCAVVAIIIYTRGDE